MSRIEEIDTEIAKLKDELLDVRGREAEVYTRIVGYYRSVKNWNVGKRDEYDDRKVFSIGCACAKEIQGVKDD